MFYMRCTPRYNARYSPSGSRMGSPLWGYIRLVYLCVCAGNYRGYLLDLSVKFTYAFDDATALHRHCFYIFWERLTCYCWLL